MSRDFDNNMKKIIDSNKELHKDTDKFQKELADIKKLVKSLDSKLTSLEEKVDQIFEILNTFSVMMYEEEDLDGDESVENEDWTPYNDDNWEDNTDDDNDTDSYYPDNFSDN
jgi:Fic family protein